MAEGPVVSVQTSGEMRVVPAERGTEWLLAGWRTFRAEPGLWVLIALPLFLFNMLLVYPPLLIWGSAVFTILFPIIGAGLMAATDAQQRGEPLKFDYLHLGFRENTGPLATVGGMLLLAMVASNLVGGAIIGISFLVGGIGATGIGTVLSLAGFLMAGLVVFSLFIAIGMAACFAPALVMLSLRPPKEALRESLYACVRNWLPMLVFSVLVCALMVLCLLTAGLGLLVLIPVISSAIYHAYRDIFA
ncbi:MAG: hypothetical protein EKK46_07950 [Rhodocyclaceae bacterium]|nr:MAG: hypothetical protein EKK46_07950 [Rhodocyclaceae bacterium]